MRGVLHGLKWGVAILLGCALICGVAAAPRANAELLPYELDPALSLTGDCSTDSLDPVPDPICPTVTPSGRFDKPVAVAVDPYGDEYVATVPESGKGWIDIFDDEGNFLTQIKGTDTEHLKDIAVDSEGNLYAFNKGSGDLLRFPPSVYEPETGEISYGELPVLVSGGSFVGAVAVDRTDDQVLVVRSGVITRYASAKEGNGVIATSGSIGPWTESLAVDSKRQRLYVTNCKGETTECDVEVREAVAPFAPLHGPIDGSNTPAGKFAAIQGRLSIAVDEESGDVFVGDLIGAKKVYRFDKNYQYLSTQFNKNFAANETLQMAVSNGEIGSGDAFNRHALFVPVLDSSGRVLAFRPPDQQAPQIEAVFSAGVGQSEAGLRAKIKPNGVATEYRFEYTTQEEFEAHAYTGATVAGEGTIPGSTFEATVATQLSGLAPGTTYRFRVLAKNEVGDGSGANEGSFTTYSEAPVSPECPNDAVRTGNSSLLPDCRAYELVSPADTGGRAPFAARDSSMGIWTGSPDGSSVTFNGDGGAFPGQDTPGGYNSDDYVSRRGADGWVTEAVGLLGRQSAGQIPLGISPDHGFTAVHAKAAGNLEGELSSPGNESDYLRYPDGSVHLIGEGSIGQAHNVVPLYIASGGTHITFRTTRTIPYIAVQLEPNAPPTGTEAIYDRTADGVTHVVSLLPNEITPAAGQDAIYLGSSADGSTIAFKFGGGPLYLRLDDAQTVEAAPAGATFAGLSQNGRYLFYLQAGDLYRYDTQAEASVGLTNGADATPAYVSADGSSAYFVSKTVLTSEVGPHGATAVNGQFNLYLSREGEVHFIGTVTDPDVKGELFLGGYIGGFAEWLKGINASGFLPARASADGTVLLFASHADLTGFNSNGRKQVYRYDAIQRTLACLSCDPTGSTAPSADASLLSPGEMQKIQGVAPSSAFSIVPNLSPDGQRAFFESDERLVAADEDGLRDVYEWEAEGKGSCAQPGGCLFLITSGQSGHDDYLYGASESGDDVFVYTADLLNGEDTEDAPSIYDARVGGGFPPRQAAAGECQGEACQPAAVVPNDPTPASSSFQGPGNVKPEGKARCPKGKRSIRRGGRHRCVPRHHKHHKKHHKKRQATNGRAGR